MYKRTSEVLQRGPFPNSRTWLNRDWPWSNSSHMNLFVTKWALCPIDKDLNSRNEKNLNSFKNYVLISYRKLTMVIKFLKLLTKWGLKLEQRLQKTFQAWGQRLLQYPKITFFFLYFQNFESNLLVPQCNSGFPSETQLFYQDIAEEDFYSEK